MADDAEKPRGVRASLVLDVTGMPEVIAAARREMARLLREAAQDEGAEVASFAARIAAAFEAGQEP